MQAREAITILEALDPSYEVTLDIGIKFKRIKPVEPLPSANAYLPGHPYFGYTDPNVIPYRKNEITCKMH